MPVWLLAIKLNGSSVAQCEARKCCCRRCCACTIRATPCHVRPLVPTLAPADPGLVGNLLVERLIGAHIWQVRLAVVLCGASMAWPVRWLMIQAWEPILWQCRRCNAAAAQEASISRTRHPGSAASRLPSAPTTSSFFIYSFRQVTKEEYGRHGGVALGERLAQQLRAEGHNPFVIPVGGSSPLGVWG